MLSFLLILVCCIQVSYGVVLEDVWGRYETVFGSHLQNVVTSSIVLQNIEDSSKSSLENFENLYYACIDYQYGVPGCVYFKVLSFFILC
jgi:hypothetical protein